MPTKKRSERTNLSEEVDSIDTSADLNIRNSNKRPRSEILDVREYGRTRPLLKRRDSILNSSRGLNGSDIEMSLRESRYVELHSELRLILFNKDTENLEAFVDNRGECYQYTS